MSGNNVEVKSEPLSMIGGAPGEARADDDSDLTSIMQMKFCVTRLSMFGKGLE